MHSLKKRLEVESQIHKEDNLKIMRDNMDLISKIKEVRNSIKDLAKKKRNAENNYKKECTKYGIKPPSKKEMEEQEIRIKADAERECTAQADELN